MALLIFYDIEDNKLRARMAKILQDRGAMRIQKSVFLFAGSRRLFAYTGRQLQAWMDKKGEAGDKLYILSVKPGAIRGMTMLGLEMEVDLLIGHGLIFL